jgi:hypothetical protein
LSLELQLVDEPGALRVQVRCDETLATLRARDAVRTVELASVPEALRPRLLALAIAELRPAPPAPPATPPRIPSAHQDPQRYRLWIGAHGQLSSLRAAGAQLQGSAQLHSILAWSSSVTFSQGTLAIDRGDLRVRHVSISSGPALQRELGHITLLARLGLRAGWLGLRGLPSEANVQGHRFDTWFVGPSVFGSAAVRVSQHGLVALGLELTNTVRQLHAQVRGGDERVLSTWLGGATLGVGASW